MSEVIKGKDFEIKNLTPQMGQFKLTDPKKEYTGFDTNYLVLDMGSKQKGDHATCNFLFTSDTLKITSTGASCGCTKPSFQMTEKDNEQFVTVVFDPRQITKNVSKWFTLYLNGVEKQIKVNLVINKN